jgi:choline-sulfatase
MHLDGSRQYAGFDHRPYGDLIGHGGHQGEPPKPVIQGDQMPDWEHLLTETGVTNIPESLLQEQNVVQESMSFLREHRHRRSDQPWFLWASFSRPHWPRTVPKRHFDRYWPDDVPEPKISDESGTYDHPVVDATAEFTHSRGITDEQQRRARAAYFACVDYLDEIIGSFLTQLEDAGFLDNTIIVYTSDHGEMGGEHGLWEKATWYEASAHVPLFIQLPSHRSGKQEPRNFDTPVNLLDLYPTLCNLVGASPPEGLDGTDLSDALRTNTSPQSRPIFVDSFVSQNPDHHYRMVREGRYKYVHFRDAPDLLFDLESDPLESENLLESDGSDIDSIRERLKGIIEESIDFEEVTAARERDASLKSEYELGTSSGDPNQYEFPDGRIVDADTPLYHPHVVCDSPELIFDDYPDQGRDT